MKLPFQFALAAVFAFTGALTVAQEASPSVVTSGTPNSSERQIGCDKEGIQKWFLNDMDQQRVHLTGSIVGIRLNNDNWWDDGDWNICINPDSAFDEYARNRWGSVTGAGSRCGVDVPAGTIEAEVNSGVPLSWMRSHFPQGTKVAAYGWWVYDAGHPEQNKPAELHPLSWLATTDSNPAYVAVAQDLTGRFGVSEWVLEEGIGFKYPSPVAGGVLAPSPSKSVDVLVERSEMRRMHASPRPDSVVFNVRLEGAIGCMCACAGIAYGDTRQFTWTASLAHSTEDLLSETVTWTVGPLSGGAVPKIGRLKIAAELAPPAAASLAHVKWAYEWQSAFGGMPINQTTTQAVGPFRIEYEVVYAPGEGYTKRHWTLGVAGSSVPEGSLAMGAPDNYGYERAYIGARRAYTIPQSRLALDHQRKGSRPGSCSDIHYVSIDKSQLLPEVGILGSLRYSVRALKNQTGDAVNEDWTVIAPGTTRTTSVYTARLQSSERIDIQLRPRVPFLSNVNLSAVHLLVTGTSELGEPLKKDLVVTARCGVLRWSPEEIYERMSRALHARGYPTEIYMVMRRLREDDRAWATAYAKWHAGRPLSSIETESLGRILQQAETLPKGREHPDPPGAQPARLLRVIAPVREGSVGSGISMERRQMR